MYLGQRFHGFASEAQMEPTVESEIFKALERTKLLMGTRKKSHYSRCGITDKGVSATGQICLSRERRTNKKISNRSTNHRNQNSMNTHIIRWKTQSEKTTGEERIELFTMEKNEYNHRQPCVSSQVEYCQGALPPWTPAA